MAKSKKLTFNMLAVGAGKPEVNVVKFNNGKKEFEISVKSCLTLDEAKMFVKTVSDACASFSTAAYEPEFYDFALKLSTLVFYAGISVPTDLYKAHDVIYNTNIYDVVLGKINGEQYRVLCDAINRRIDYVVNTFVSVQAARLNEVIERINGVFDESNKVISAITSQEFVSQLNEAVNSISSGKADDKSDDVEVVDENDNIIIFSKEEE